MAFQSRHRDPLFDSNMQAAIERRGREMVGIVLIVLGVMAAMMIGSYSPDDPSFLSATDAPIHNWMGRLGASIAAPLFMIVGWGSWALALVLVVWGLRLAFHVGSERALNRMIFAPIAIAVAAIYASTLAPGPSWTHSFGLGGLFGDTFLLVILQVLPVSAATGARFMSAVSGFGMVALGLFVLGFTRPELRLIWRYMLYGIVMTYAYAMRLIGRGAVASVKAAGMGATLARQMHRDRQARKAEEREFADYEEDDEPVYEAPRAASVIRAEPPVIGGAPTAAAPSPLVAEPIMRPAVEEPKPSLLGRLMPGFRSGAAQPDANAQPEDRVQARINAAIQARAQSGKPVSPEAPTLDQRRTDAVQSRLTLSDPSIAAPIEAPVSVPVPEADDDDLIYTEADFEIAEPDAAIARPAVPERSVRVVQPKPKKPQPSMQARAEAQPSLAFDDNRPAFEAPPLSLLTNPIEVDRHHLPDEALEENARMLESVLDDYGVKGEIVSVRPGPVVTMYELEPAPGLKASRVIGLSDDIARSMSALSARVSTVPGRSVIGIELPNINREKVVLREILSTRDFGDSNMRLPLALGKDIGGDPIVANLAKMPHLLIAGTTGSGKSVAINTMILSLLYKLSPEECRLIMIDPKMLELSVYDGIPHLLSPVVTDPKKAVVALKWVVGEMEERYRKMSKMGVRNIDGFNGRVKDALSKGEMFSRTVQTGFDDETGDPIFETEEFQPEILPYIVVIVDEMADLMMVAGKEIEACIQRLAQMARASGIHLIMATQRPSVDVITGTIKANFPTRISFQVTSKIDSRTILGEMGAEQLLGMGDMLYMAGGSKITRVHGPFVSDEEVEEIVNHLKAFGPPEYMSGVVDGPEDEKASDIDMVLGLGGNTDGEDALYDQAVAIVIKDRKCSTSYIQRKLAIGYNKAARLVEQMEDQGVVSSANHVGKREILVPEQG